ncbi:MAG TPA: DUF5995 family protein [Polyangiaceae bacterium]|nr:DUF5995 family protein [Polyangiaceae bacterium]
MRRCLPGALALAIPWLSLGAARADDPPFVPWSALLPGLTTTYEPSSANDCQSGQLHCVDAVIREMQRRFEPLDASCNHNLLFALTYLRTTEEYRRAVVEPGFFSDPNFINHQDANFAQQYFDAWDQYRAGVLGAVPRAWQLAFRSADSRLVNGTGDVLLGMSAHVNRDLPFVLAAIGLVKPDGSSRKPDHDQVNVFLNRVIEPLFDEMAARYDPLVDDTQVDGTQLDEAALLQILVGWREQAWRNAEALVSAPTPAARALVENQIEQQAAIEANLIIVATAYTALSVQQALAELAGLPVDPARVLQAVSDHNLNVLHGVLGTLLTPGTVIRDNYCAAHG